MAEVVFHPRAVADIEEIVLYLLKRGDRGVAEAIRSHLLGRAASLGTHVRLGMRSSHPSIHILSPAKYPYRIYFTRAAERIVILHIRHTARRLPGNLARLLDEP